MNILGETDRETLLYLAQLPTPLAGRLVKLVNVLGGLSQPEKVAVAKRLVDSTKSLTTSTDLTGGQAFEVVTEVLELLTHLDESRKRRTRQRGGVA